MLTFFTRLAGSYMQISRSVFPKHFPCTRDSNKDSLLRLMESVLIERYEVLQNSRTSFSAATYATLMNLELLARLSIIAQEHLQLNAA